VRATINATNPHTHAHTHTHTHIRSELVGGGGSGRSCLRLGALGSVALLCLARQRASKQKDDARTATKTHKLTKAAFGFRRPTPTRAPEQPYSHPSQSVGELSTCVSVSRCVSLRVCLWLALSTTAVQLLACLLLVSSCLVSSRLLASRLFWSLVSSMAFSRDNARVAWLSSPLISRCIVALMMMLALLVGDAAAQSYTLRASASIVGTAANQAQGWVVAMSGNGLVSLSVSSSASTGPVLAVASSPAATTTKTSLSLPFTCTYWNRIGSVSLSGNMFAVACTVPPSTSSVVVYQTSSPSTPFPLISNAFFSALSEDGSTLAVAPTGLSTVTIYKLSMGSYSLVQTIITGSPFRIGALAIAPDASALAISLSQVSGPGRQTFFYGWVTNQFVAATSLSVRCSLAVSSQSSSGATTIACAAGSVSLYSLVNTMGSLSFTTQATISGSYAGAAITPDGSTVALSGTSSTIIASATTGSTIATISEGGASVAISSDAATVFLGDNTFNSFAGRAVWYDSNVAPTITLQPVSVSKTAPSSATFTAAATGYVAVQWSFTGSVTRRRSVLGATPIPGATSTSFTTSATTLAFNGNTYSATFTSAAGVSTTTSAATLTVSGGSSGSPPVVTSNPTSTTVTSGAAATFIAAASGSPTPTVQWQGTLETHSHLLTRKSCTTTLSCC